MSKTCCAWCTLLCSLQIPIDRSTICRWRPVHSAGQPRRPDFPCVGQAASQIHLARALELMFAEPQKGRVVIIVELLREAGVEAKRGVLKERMG